MCATTFRVAGALLLAACGGSASTTPTGVPDTGSDGGALDAAHPADGFAADGAPAPPDVVGSAAPCLVGGNVFSVAQGGRPAKAVGPSRWSAYAAPGDGAQPTSLGVRVEESDGMPGALYLATFAAPTPLTVGVYEDALPPHLAGAMQNGLELEVDWLCNGRGRFQIRELGLAGDALRRFTATFEQDCQGNGRVTGCIHFEEP